MNAQRLKCFLGFHDWSRSIKRKNHLGYEKSRHCKRPMCGGKEVVYL